MIILLIFLKYFYALSENKILDIVIGRKTRIRPTHYSYVAMGYNEKDNNFVSIKDTDSKLAEIKINKDGDSYILGSGKSWLCIKDGDLKKCKEPTKLEINASNLGFQISYGNRCLTAGMVYRFEGCNKNSDKQEFVIEIDKKLVCSDFFIEIDGSKFDIRKNIDLKKADNKKFNEAIKKMNLKDPEIKKNLKKLWDGRRRKWPSWGLC